ncbi:MAG: hypothetical protein ISS88_02490 [Candidatus Portnoybacteria bacterium]|nr:hypothetical protein [Candidatus Portnoybacteria bacterium]
MGENTEMVERKIEVVKRQFKEGVGNDDVVSLNIKCSEWFAEEVLNRIMPLMDRQGSNLELGNVNSFLPKTDAAIVNRISSDRQSHSSGTGWRKRFAVAACLIFFVILSVYGFNVYSKSRQGQASMLANYEKRRAETEAYEEILAKNAENLLRNLRVLTSVSERFQKAFPGVTTMAGIARFLRGPEPIEKAKTAKKFLLKAKENFDHWIRIPEDFTEKQKATKKDIADFLSVWEEIEFLLNIIEEERALTIAAIQG